MVTWRTVRTIIGCACILIFVASCSMRGGGSFGRYGRIEPDGGVMESFESYRVHTNLRYYISGPDLYPNALIGIDRRHVLVSDLWKERNFTRDGLKIIVENMRSKGWEYGAMMHGFNILDDGGNDVGDLYAILSVMITVEMLDENRVVIHTPPLDTYEKIKIKIRDDN